MVVLDNLQVKLKIRSFCLRCLIGLGIKTSAYFPSLI